MGVDIDVPEAVERIFKLFSKENLLREVDPFTMRWLRQESECIIDRALDGTDSYDAGYEEGYRDGKSAAEDED